jgi:hypothetical protein
MDGLCVLSCYDGTSAPSASPTTPTYVPTAVPSAIPGVPTAVPTAVRTVAPTLGNELCMYDECEIGGPRLCEAGTYCKQINPYLFECTENDETRGVPGPYSPIDGDQICYPTIDGAYPGLADVKVCNKLHARIFKFLI